MDPSADVKSKESIHAVWRAGDSAAQFMLGMASTATSHLVCIAWCMMRMVGSAALGMARRVDRAVALSVFA